MFSFFRSYREAERAALAPLVSAALALDPADVPGFLDDLRRDAPTVAARLQELLARPLAPTPEPTHRAALDQHNSATTAPLRLHHIGPSGRLADAEIASGTAHAAAA